MTDNNHGAKQSDPSSPTNRDSPLKRIIVLLDDKDCVPRQSGESWIVLCPAHDDNNPSLSISEAADGKVLLHCHAGCDVDAIVEALGLTMANLFPAK